MSTNNGVKGVVLVVGIHGLQATPGMQKKLTGHVAQRLEEAGWSPRVLIPKSNKGKTTRGVIEGGTNVATEIIEGVHSIPGDGPVGLVVMGHSLGGLYARYALPLVFEDPQAGARLRPMSFVTLNTPHLGSLRFNGAEKLLVETFLKTAGETGRDVSLENTVLLDLCNERHTNALARFPHRTLVAPIDGDLCVPYSSASARAINPYQKRTFMWWFRPTDRATFRVVGHSGFSSVETQVLSLDPHLRYEAPEAPPIVGPDAEEWVCDNECMRTKRSLLKAICSPPVPNDPPGQHSFWRRLDVSFSPPAWSQLRIHDMTTGTLQLPSDMPACHDCMDLVARAVTCDASTLPWTKLDSQKVWAVSSWSEERRSRRRSWRGRSGWG